MPGLDWLFCIQKDQQADESPGVGLVSHLESIADILQVSGGISIQLRKRDCQCVGGQPKNGRLGAVESSFNFVKDAL